MVNPFQHPETAGLVGALAGAAVFVLGRGVWALGTAFLVRREAQAALDTRVHREDLALEAELNRTYVGSVERGERNVSLVNIHRLANALEVSPKEFF